jgi:hypothetical protein
VGPIVEGPPAVWVAAGFQPLPGAVPLRIADHQQQAGQPGSGLAGGLGPEADLPTRPDLQRRPGVLGDGLDGVEVAGRGRGAAAVGYQHGPDALTHTAGEVQLGRLRRAVSPSEHRQSLVQCSKLCC